MFARWFSEVSGLCKRLVALVRITPVRFAVLAGLAIYLINPNAISSRAGARVFPESPIKVVDRAKFTQFASVGLIKRLVDVSDEALAKPFPKTFVLTPQPGSATGIYLDDCVVITNYHVAFGKTDVAHRIEDFKMQFRVGNKPNDGFAHQSIITPRVMGNLFTQDFVAASDPSCTGREFDKFTSSYLTSGQLVRMKARVILVSFSGGANEDDMTVSAGTVTGIDPETGYVTFNASAKAGSSGGAVLVRDPITGKLLLQGLNVGANETQNAFMNIVEIVEIPSLIEFRKLAAKDKHGTIKSEGLVDTR